MLEWGDRLGGNTQKLFMSVLHCLLRNQTEAVIMSAFQDYEEVIIKFNPKELVGVFSLFLDIESYFHMINRSFLRFGKFLSFASSEFYLERIQKPIVAEEEIELDYDIRRSNKLSKERTRSDL